MMKLRDSESGAVLLIVAGSMILLLAIAALVLDLASVRADRALSRTVSDNAATAGSLELWAGDGQAACQAALAYLDLNMPDGPFTGANCADLPSSCGPSTAMAFTQATAGPWTATLTYPVPDGDPLLDPAAIGATTQALHAEDGVQCERFGVQIDGLRQYFFADVIGAASKNTEVHAVARATPDDTSDMVLNLLILERYDCDAISAAGQGGIITEAILNPGDPAAGIPPFLEPGWIAVDSDASSGTNCAANGVIDVDSVNAEIRADGPPGCPGELITGPGDGCGEIRTLAPGTPGCNPDACTSSNPLSPAPDPDYMPRRVTRAPVDHRYNCNGSYSFGAGWEISPCTKGTPDYIDQLVGQMGPAAGTPPPGFVTWTSIVPAAWPPGQRCNPPSGEVFTAPAGVNVYVDCSPKLTVNGEIYFPDSDVIFEGDVDLQTGATLSFNAPAPSTPNIVYMRDGQIKKAGSANLYIHNSTVYMSSSSTLSLTGGTGELVWTAPNIDGYRFDDLALWSEGTSSHDFAGQAVLDLSGVFFVPLGQVRYTGQGVQHQVSAQFISRTLLAGGQGLLIVAPEFDHSVLFPELLDISLIR